jgi:ParB-like chromosome segregation protein Spo0J
MKKPQVVGRERMPIENLEPAPYNPRNITGEEYAALRASIEKFGLAPALPGR